jgi:hypothetical protein
MTVDFVYQLMQFVINKNQNGYLSPQDFNNIINQAQFSYLDLLLGQFQSYQVGRPVPKVQFGMNENVRNTLTAFIDTPTLLAIDATGLAPYPDDYQQADAMYDAYMNRVRFVPQHKLFSYLNSQIDPISNPNNAIYLLESGGFRFYPNATYNNVVFANAKLSYVHTPPNIVWGFTPDGDGRPVYNPATSVDPLWYDADMEDVIVRALALVGVNLEAQQVSQYAQMIKSQGQ